MDERLTTPIARWPGLIKTRVIRTSRFFSLWCGISLAVHVSGKTSSRHSNTKTKIYPRQKRFRLCEVPVERPKNIWTRGQQCWRRAVQPDLFILFCVCKNPACQIGFKSFGCKSAENVMGTAAVTDTQNSPHTAITIANTTVPSLSNSRLTFGWRKHTQR